MFLRMVVVVTMLVLFTPAIVLAGGSLGFPEGIDSETPSQIHERVVGKILLQVEEQGEAFYVYPEDGRKYYLGRPADAFDIMRYTGLGITDADLARIPVEGTSWDAPAALLRQVRGRILLQIEQNGEAWYVDPSTGKRSFLNRPADAFDIMRGKGVGVTNDLLAQVRSEITFYRPTRSDIELNAVEGYTTYDYLGIQNQGVVPRTLKGWKLKFEDGNALSLRTHADSQSQTIFVVVREYGQLTELLIRGAGLGTNMEYWTWNKYPHAESIDIELLADTGSVVARLRDVDAYLRASGETFNESNGYY